RRGVQVQRLEAMEFRAGGHVLIQHRSLEGMDVSGPFRSLVCNGVRRLDGRGEAFLWEPGARLYLAHDRHSFPGRNSTDWHRCPRRIYRPDLHGIETAPEIYRFQANRQSP